ncbi:MAG: hypothetical protein V7668_19050 [Cereibacter changlensis]|uniref:hypothetical protein n=1 Tax=Cereibacter changlensis TaxID=402884 RepID=UPI001FE65B8D|nr:hypothetical protein [Cereibacter changlensis]
MLRQLFPRRAIFRLPAPARRKALRRFGDRAQHGRGESHIFRREVAMIELMFVVCMSASPQDCEKKSLYYNDISHQACMLGAAPTLAKWVGEHPQWQLQRWACRAKDPSEKDA